MLPMSVETLVKELTKLVSDLGSLIAKVEQLIDKKLDES